MPAADDQKTKDKRGKWRDFVHSLNPEIDPDTVRLMDSYLVIFHSMRRVGENSLADSGLSMPKYRLLLSLMYSETMDDLSELNPSEISRRQGTSRNTISSLIRDLEDEGLVERHLDQKDRRRFNIGLTDDGRELVRRYSTNHFQAVASCFDGLRLDEREDLRQLLAKLGDQTFSVAGEAAKT